MKSPLRSRPAIIGTTLLTLTIAGGTTVALASDQYSGDTYQACLSRTGMLYNVKANSTRPPRCSTFDKVIAWNQGGPQGPTGAAGPAGPQGPKGDVGAAGPQGAKGDTGPAGAQGAKGDTGPAGPAGAVGPAGPAGPVGPAGPAGPQGAKGDVGPAGPAGPAGPQGSPGPTGPAGPAGAAGISGYQVVAVSRTIQPLPTYTSEATPSASCPVGKVLLGGGGYTSSNAGYLVSDGPVVDSGTVYNTWEVDYIVPATAATIDKITVTAVAYCVNSPT